MRPIKISNIIWDWNGTLIDDVNICLDIFNKQLSKAGIKPKTLYEYRKIFTFPLKRVYEQLGVDFSKTPYTEIANNFAKEYNKKRFTANLSDGVKEFIIKSAKQGIKHYVLSAYNENMLKEALEYYDIAKYFSEIRGLDNTLAHGKKEIAEELIKKISDKDYTVLIGDTLHDFEVARHIGVTPLLYTKGYDSEEKLKKTDAVLINSFTELYKIINIK